MAELSIRRQTQNRDNVSTRIKKTLLSVQAQKIELQKKQAQVKKRPGEDLLSSPTALVDLKKQTIIDKSKPQKEKEGDGSIAAAVAGQTLFAPKTIEQQKAAEQTSGGENYLNINGVKPRQKVEPNLDERNEAKQRYFRDQARVNVGLQRDDSDTKESLQEENRLQEQADIIKNNFKKYGNISDSDALKILQKKIESTSTWKSWLLDWSLEITLWFYSIATNAIIFIIATAGGFITAGVGTATSFLLGIANTIFIYILNLTIQFGLYFLNKKKIKDSLTNIREIDSLQKILKSKYVKLWRISSIIESTPILNIIPMRQINRWRFEKFKKKILVTIKKAKKKLSLFAKLKIRSGIENKKCPHQWNIIISPSIFYCPKMEFLAICIHQSLLNFNYLYKFSEPKIFHFINHITKILAFPNL
jgi:hypothetical protein